MERYKGDAPKTEAPEFNFEAPKFKKIDPKLESLISINKLNTTHPARRLVESRQIPEEFYSDLYLCTKFFQSLVQCFCEDVGLQLLHHGQKT